MYESIEHEGVVVCVIRTDEDGKTVVIPPDPANSDYQAYLTYLAEQ